MTGCAEAAGSAGLSITSQATKRPPTATSYTWSPASTTMSVDGVSVPLDMRAAVPMHRQKTCVNLPTSRERTVEVYPASGVINIDGFWVDSVADPYAANEYNPTAAQG